MPSQTQDPRIDQWVSITDFTPGLFSNTPIVGISPVLPAPLGAGDSRYTSGCMALDNGGLAPLPKVGKTYSYSDLTFGSFPTVYLTKFFPVPSYASGSSDVFFCMFEATNGSNHYVKVILFTANTTDTEVLYNNTTGTLVSVNFGGGNVFMTRIAKTGTTPSAKPGIPVLVFTIPASLEDTALVWYFPTVTAPSLPTLKKFSTTINAQTVFGYQGRVICLVAATYTWAIGEVTTNETINYTTPSNSKTLGTQELVLDPTAPFGYGSWGSISAGELFLIKTRTGAVVVTGDINYPTVTYLPGVQSTNGLSGNSAQTPGGLFYCSRSNGGWLWNGGNTSQKISQNIDDNFYACSGIAANNFFANNWGEWIMFSNSWLFNLRQQSWWKLPESTLFYFYPAREGYQFYASSAKKLTSSNHVIAYRFTKTTPVATYTWRSQPIRQGNINRVINIREIVLYASNPFNTTSTVTIRLYDGQTEIATFTTTSGQIVTEPNLIRIPTGGVQLDNCIVGLIVGGGTIVHSITLGIRVRQHVGLGQTL